MLARQIARVPNLMMVAAPECLLAVPSQERERMT
jgi:hypothetical protein